MIMPLCNSDKTSSSNGMVQARVGQKLVNVTFTSFSMTEL